MPEGEYPPRRECRRSRNTSSYTGKQPGRTARMEKVTFRRNY